MTHDKTQRGSRHQTNYRLAAIGFFLGAVCFFIAGARQGSWLILVGALNMIAGSVMVMRMRKASSQNGIETDDRSSPGEPG